MQRPTPAVLALVSFYALFIWIYALISRRDINSIFFNPRDAYKPRYSAYRTKQAEDFIKKYETAAPHKPKWSPVHDASICVGLSSSPAAAQALPVTIGSLIEGMDDAERERLHLKVLVPHTEPETHSVLSEPWLRSLVDSIVLYNQTRSAEQVDMLRALETGTSGDKETKRALDFFQLTRNCLATGARYVLMLENGVLAADGWMQRSLAALEDIEHHIDNPFYLRLFHSESMIDRSTEHSSTTYVIWSGAFVTLILAILWYIQFRQGNVKNAVPSVKARWLILLCAPALVLLFLIAERLTTISLQEGIIPMDRYNGRARGLAFSRGHATEMVDWAGAFPAGSVESILQRFTDEKSAMPFALTPSLFQHIQGNRSGLHLDNPEWSFAFELFNPEMLQSEHERFLHHGLIKHVGL